MYRDSVQANQAIVSPTSGIAGEVFITTVGAILSSFMNTVSKDIVGKFQVAVFWLHMVRKDIVGKSVYVMSHSLPGK